MIIIKLVGSSMCSQAASAVDRGTLVCADILPTPPSARGLPGCRSKILAMPIVTCLPRNGLAHVHMDDGKANAINLNFLEALNKALDDAAEAPAVILTGRPGRFCAGLDLKQLPSLPQSEQVALLSAFGKLTLRLLTFPRPIVAWVEGHAVAGGAVMLMGCDRRIGSKGDYTVGLSEVAIGIPMPSFVLELARSTLPVGSMRPAVLHGRLFNPEEAVTVGFLDRIGDEEDVREEAARLAKLPDPAYSTTKHRIYSGVKEALGKLGEDMSEFFTPAARRHAQSVTGTSGAGERL